MIIVRENAFENTKNGGIDENGKNSKNKDKNKNLGINLT